MNKREKNLQRLKQFRLLDDTFMSKVFEDIACTQLLLRIILNRNDLQVNEVHSQYTIKNLQGRSMRLDIFATDQFNKKYNIEVQRSDRGAKAKRARYHSSVIDANIIAPGEEFEALPEIYIIFITENDILKRNLPIYHINRMISETGEPFEDDTHILYVNAKIKTETELGKLMHDFSCIDPNDMNYDVLAKRVRYFKEEKEGIDIMCKIMEDMIIEDRKEMACRMLNDGILSLEKIAEYTGLSIEEVKKLADQKIA